MRAHRTQVRRKHLLNECSQSQKLEGWMDVDLLVLLLHGLPPDDRVLRMLEAFQAALFQRVDAHYLSAAFDRLT